MGVMSAADGHFAWKESQADYPPRVRLIRTLVPGSFALANMLLSLDLLRSSARRWWKGLRLVLTVCCSIRLVASVLLRELGVAPGTFPPGNLPFATAMWYNFACIVLSTVGFSQPCRHYLSELTGGSRVVVLLADVGRLPSARASSVERRSTVSSAGGLPSSALMCITMMRESFVY